MKLIFEVVASVILSVGGAGLIILSLANFLGKMWANRILEQDKAKYNREIEELKNNFIKELEYYKSQIEIYKLSLLRFSEHQFDLYNKLWLSMSELKIAGDRLWEYVDERRVSEFADKVIEVRDELLKNALLIEEPHEKELSILLGKFANYYVGKYRLIELGKKSKDSPQNLGSSIGSVLEIQSILQDNEKTKQAYDELLLKIKASFRQLLKEGTQVRNTQCNL